jgi:Kelch motif
MNFSRIAALMLVLCLIAVGPAAAYDVVILNSDTANPITAMVAQLDASPYTDNVDIIDISGVGAAPTLVAIQDYDVVIAHVNTTLADAVVTGNVLADYADLPNKGVVVMAGAFATPFSLLGRFDIDGYKPIADGAVIYTTLNLDTTEQHPITHNVLALTEAITIATVLNAGAASLGLYDSTAHIGAVKDNVVALNTYSPDGYVANDELAFLVNAARFLAGLFSEWEYLAPTDPLRAAALGAADSRYLYQYGGYDDTFALAPELARLDPVANAWTPLTAGPGDISYGDGVFYQDKLFFFGGSNDVSGTCDVSIYDIATDTWSAGTACSLNADGYRIERIGKYAYRIGGYDHDTSINVDRVLRYDLEADSWTEMAPMNGDRWSPIAGVLNGKIFVAGGNDAAYNSQDTCEVYDPDANAWDLGGCASLPLALTGANGVGYGGRLWAMGGFNAPYSVFTYDPTTDQWDYSTLYNDMPIANSITAVIDDNLYRASESFFLFAGETVRTSACPEIPTITCDSTTNGETFGSSNYFDFYSCNPTRDETGGDALFAIDLVADTFLVATVTPDDPGDDLDAYILNGCDSLTCESFGDETAVAAVEPGTYYIAVDGFEGDSGEFSLDVLCCTGCYIDGACVADAAANPANECEECDAATDRLAWSIAADDTPCDDGLFCTDTDTCQAGTCEGDGDTCEADETCDEDTDECVPAADDDDTTPDDDDDDDATPDDDDDDDDDDDTPVDDDGGDDDDDDDDSCCGC